MAVQLATKIDEKIKKAMEAYCNEHGLKMNRFIENAVLDKLEELEDIDDLKKLRREDTKPFSEVMKELKKDGKI